MTFANSRSEDYDEGVDRGSDVSIGPPSKTIGQENHMQHLAPGKPRSLLGKAPSFQAPSVLKASDHISGEESAGLLNNFINVPHGTSKAASSSSSGTPKRVSRLKRISNPSEPIYRGINAAPKGTQRRMNSRTVDIFGFDEANSQPLVNKRPVNRAPSVDPGSMNWQTQDTLGQKKRKLNAPSMSRPVADPGVTTSQAASTSQKPSSGKGEAPKVPKRGRGRPPKSRPKDDDPVEDVVPNILSGPESAIPNLLPDDQTRSIANSDKVVSSTATGGKTADNPQPPDVDSIRASKPQEISSTPRRRGRPPRPRPSHGEPVDSTVHNEVHHRPSSKKKGRPRKSITKDNHPIVGADSEGQSNHTGKEHSSGLVENAPPQKNTPSTAGEDQPNSHHVADEDGGSNLSSSVQDAQESNLPLPVSADNILNENPPQALQTEEATVPSQSDIDDPNDHQATQPPPSEMPVDQVEPSTNDARNSTEQNQADGPADEPSSRESDQEAQPVPGPVFKPSLSRAFNVAVDIDQTRQRHAVSSPKSKRAREVLQACNDVRTCIAEMKDADQGDISVLSAELHRLLSQVAEKSRGLVLEPGWSQVEARVHAIFMHILPKLALLLRYLLQHFGHNVEECTYKQLRTIHILVDAIVYLGSKVKSIKPEFEFEFAVVRVVKQVVVKGVESVLKDVQTQIRKIEDARQAAERAVRQREERRLREQEEMSSIRNMNILEEWKAEWDRLHAERWIAELNGRSFLSSGSKQNHLRLVSLELDVVELDGNGDPIERVEVFRQRTTRPPGQSGHVQQWAIQDHVYALAKGLQQFSG